MQLKSISFNHHRVFGSTHIDLFGDSKPLTENITDKYHTDLFLEIDDVPKPNHYTYIVGENGVGKTLLFKNIISYVNTNSRLKNESLNRIINLYEKSLKYRRIRDFDLSHTELEDVDIYNKYFFVKSDIKQNDILAFYDSQLLYISSVFSEANFHKNERFRSFNYLSKINKTNILFLLALKRYYDTSHLKSLNKLLNKDDAKWELDCGLSYEGAGGIDDNTSTVLLKNENGINIVNFLSLVSKISILDERIDKTNLTDEELKVFDVIYNSISFFKLLHNSNLPVSDFFEKIASNKIISSIQNFLSKKVDSSGIEESLNVKIKKNVDWGFLFINPTQLEDFDIFFLALLEDLNLITTKILCNNISIEKFSSGEQSLIRLFSFFSDLPIQGKKENLLVLFDEPENSLHPKWQQNFPLYFKQIVEDVYQIKNSHFIFATHSPLTIMKSALISNSNVLQFSRDGNNAFRSRQIDNINSFSIEEVLLDEFKISYRDKEIELKVEQILRNKQSEIVNTSDPIFSIEKSFELKKRIDDLFNKFKSEG